MEACAAATEDDEATAEIGPLTPERPCGQLADPLGRTPLHYAAHAGHLETCRLLVRHTLSQADPATRDAVYQWNAVHHSASQVSGYFEFYRRVECCFFNQMSFVG